MKKLVLAVCGIAMLICGSLRAQDIAGDWQGTVKMDTDLRIVLKISRADKGGWKAMFYSIDQGPDGFPVSSITFDKSILKYSIESIDGAYEGKLSADGNTITGTWTQGSTFQLNFQRPTKETAWKIDSSPHTVQFIEVEKGIKLEVLDWGGTGRPLVLLAGLGNTAHIFDQFAPKLTAKYHVYGITRRGFGASSVPTPNAQNYSSDRLGEDVLAVDDARELNRPVLVGHSIAGEELSSIGTRHPEKVAGLIYLDAGYPYAVYDSSRGDLQVDSNEFQQNLEQLLPGKVPDRKQVIQDLLANLPQLQRDLQNQLKLLQTIPSTQLKPPIPPFFATDDAVIAGEHKYTTIPVPCLAIFAVPHDPNSLPPMDASARAAFLARDLERTTAQAKAFQEQVPSAHVVRIPNANHYVFKSNEADVLREMNAFLEKLPED